MWFGREDYGWNGKPADVLPLLQRTDWTKLKSLALKNHEIGDELCGMVAKSPLLAQLESLDLSMSTIGDEGADILVKHASAFAHLKKLDLSDCYLTPEGVAQLKAALPNAVVSEQRTPDDWGDGEMHRYSSVGE